MSELLKKHSHNCLNPEQWVDRYGNYLYNFAIGRLRNHQNAENVVQETFLAALHSQDRFSGESSERTWLTSILKHKIVDHMRKSYRERPVSELQDPDLGIDQFFDHANRHKKKPSKWLPDPDKLLENKEFWEVFRDCKDKLPSLINDAFTLKEIEQMERAEICKILNITQANYWVLLHRARLQLRQCLEGNWFEISDDH